MQPEEVMEKLLTSSGGEVQVTIERDFVITLPDEEKNYRNLVGVKLGFSRMEGLVVEYIYKDQAADKGGIKEEDVIEKLQGRLARYMMPEDVENIIQSRRGETLSLKIKRNISIPKGI